MSLSFPFSSPLLSLFLLPFYSPLLSPFLLPFYSCSSLLNIRTHPIRSCPFQCLATLSHFISYCLLPSRFLQSVSCSHSLYSPFFPARNRLVLQLRSLSVGNYVSQYRMRVYCIKKYVCSAGHRNIIYNPLYKHSPLTPSFLPSQCSHFLIATTTKHSPVISSPRRYSTGY